MIPAAVWQAFCLACPGEDYDGEPLLWRRDAPGKRTRRLLFFAICPENPARRPIHEMQLGARKAGEGLVAVLTPSAFLYRPTLDQLARSGATKNESRNWEVNGTTAATFLTLAKGGRPVPKQNVQGMHTIL